MNPINSQELAKWLQTLLEETFAKPSGQPGYMLDRSATGLLGTLTTLSAEAASRPTQPGTTIAAQAAHVAFIQEAFIHWIMGEDYKADWSRSWPVQEVGSSEWEVLRERLGQQHQQLMSLLEQHQAQDPLENVALLIAHSAYHLGAIRQIARGLNLI